MAATLSGEDDWESLLVRQRVPKRYLHDVLLEYFVVEGQREVAEAFSKESGCSVKGLGVMDDRVAIRDHILAGQIADAVARLNKLDAGILRGDAQLRFLMWRQQFIEHVRRGEVDGALRVAQQTLLPITERELEQAMALLAFPNPMRCPVAALLSSAQRDETARRVNSAMLIAVGHPTEARLPGVLRQLCRSQKRLRTQCSFPEVQDLARAVVPTEWRPTRTGSGSGAGAGAVAGDAAAAFGSSGVAAGVGGAARGLHGDSDHDMG